MNKLLHKTETDVLVIGAGGAGARAALEAARHGARVIVASKGPLGKSGLTPTANGGYQAPFQEGDSPANYFADQMRLGRYLNDPHLVKVQAEEALPCLKELEAMGAQVSWKPSSFEPSLSKPRSAMIPGKVMMQTLRRALLAEPGVTLAEYWAVTHLLADGDRLAGALALDMKAGRQVLVSCAAAVLATGGVGEVYGQTAASPMGIPTGTVGEGCWLAARAGAELVDMEMVQFVVIPVRPEIAYGLRHLPWGPFRNRDGREFISPGEGPYSELAARQVAAEIAAGRGPVYIDLTGREYQSTARHPVARARDRALFNLGLTPYQGRLEVGVGSLYSMGGVRINERCETSIRGLFAAGEVTGNVHGARRMAGNAFPEITVFGRRAGRFAAQYAAVHSPANPGDLGESTLRAEQEAGKALLASDRPVPSCASVKREIQRLMDTYVQVERCEEGLLRAEKALAELAESARRVGLAAQAGPLSPTTMESLTLPAMHAVATMIVAAARARRESRGAHYRTDFPREESVIQHTRIRWKEGEPVADLIPVERLE